MTERELVYIASPYAGDVQENILAAQNACQYAMAQGGSHSSAFNVPAVFRWKFAG